MHISHGVYGQRISVGGRDEFHDLAENFNQMASSIQEKINELDKTAAAALIAESSLVMTMILGNVSANTSPSTIPVTNPANPTAQPQTGTVQPTVQPQSTASQPQGAPQVTGEYTVIDRSKTVYENKDKLSLRGMPLEQIGEECNAILSKQIPGEKDITADEKFYQVDVNSVSGTIINAAGYYRYGSPSRG